MAETRYWSLSGPKPLGQRVIEAGGLAACGFYGLICSVAFFHCLGFAIGNPPGSLSELFIQILSFGALGAVAVYALLTMRREIRCPRPSWRLVEVSAPTPTVSSSNKMEQS